MKKRVFPILMALCLAALMPAAFEPAVVWADSGAMGYIEPEKDMYHVPRKSQKMQDSSDVFPARYDAREEEWFSGIRVKNQRGFGLCWAFAVTTAAEISYAKETYAQTGEVYEMSPTHLAYFSTLTHRMPDPLGYTSGDSGADYTPWDGGNLTIALNHLATWSGLGLERNTPFQDLQDFVDAGNDRYSFTYDSQYAYDNYAVVQNAVYYGKSANVASIKKMLMDYGAAVTSMRPNTSFFANGDLDKGAFYYKNVSNKSYGNNHAVTIIGWDDDYPKENFASYDGSTYCLQPENDGAWIVQNSWGTERHDQGYFYISYESEDILRGEQLALDLQRPDAYDYNYQYDGNPLFAFSDDDTWNVGIRTDRGNKAANIFRAATGIDLRAIGLMEYTDGYAAYRADIYTGVSDTSDPTSGRLASSFKFTTETGGFKTIELPEPVNILPGDNYSIVITILSEHSAIGREEDICSYPIRLDPRQSLIYDAAAGEWRDLYDYGTCFRIKGFADWALGSIQDAGVVLSRTAFTYNGKVQRPLINNIDGKTLNAGTDYTEKWSDEYSQNAGTYTVTIKGKGSYTGTTKATYTINKAANPLKMSAKVVTVKYSKLKKKAQTLAVTKVIKFTKQLKDKKTYTLSSAKKGSKSFKEYFKINQNTGKVTVRKGLKKGTYKVKVKVKAAGNTNYKASGNKMVTFTIKIK